MNIPGTALSILAAALLASCAPAVKQEQASLAERTAPAYVQWLESRACLRKAPFLASVVSGTSLNWMKNGTGLQGKSMVWVAVSPASFPEHKNAFFSGGCSKEFLHSLAGLGIEGIFLADTAEMVSLLDRAMPEEETDGSGVTGMEFGSQAGSEREYEEMLLNARSSNLAAGGELLPAATGTGPDFILATLGVRNYPGMYFLAEIPSRLWSFLPPAGNGAVPAGKKLTELLADEKIIPGSMRQDKDASAGISSGWAVTGIRRGIDGVARRWLYRWHGSHGSPVLNWQDPSAAARRVMEASLIMQAGLRHQALAGLSAGAWIGMNAGEEDQPGLALEPALSAVRDLSATARRYGSELLLEDCLPAKILPAVMQANKGFTRDSYSCPSLEESILLQNAGPLRAMLQDALDAHADFRRLWHSSSDLFPFPLRFLSVSLPETLKPCLSPEGMLRIGAVQAAAASLPLKDGDALSRSTAIRKAAEIQKAVLACLPGLLLLSKDDLDPVIEQPSDQTVQEGYRDTIRKLIRLRAVCGIPGSRLLSLPPSSSPAVLNMLLELPDGRRLLFTGNLSGQHARPLADAGISREGWKDAFTGAAVSPEQPLAPWEWKICISQK